MGFLTSAYKWLHGQLNTGLLASPAPPNMSLNSSPNHIGSPIKMNLGNPDPIKVYNPYVWPYVPGVNPLGDDPDPNNPSPMSYPHSASGLSPAKVKAVDYLNADLAKHYGMSKSTAYQEALANTGYQRSVADMKAAGLNPAVLFGSGHGSPANSSVYASSGGSGRSYGRSSGSDKLFSGSAYSFLQAVGGLVGIAVTGKPDGFWIGSQTAKGAMGLLDSVSKK